MYIDILNIYINTNAFSLLKVSNHIKNRALLYVFGHLNMVSQPEYGMQNLHCGYGTKD